MRTCLALRIAPVATLIAFVAFSPHPAGAAPERGAPAAAGIEPIERTELPGGIVREKLRLPGFDPDESVPAIAFHPSSGGPFPLTIALHPFRGAKENMDGWCRDLAARGIFALAIDAHFHGERSIAGVFHGEGIASLGGEYSIWVHQSSIARAVKDVPVILDALARRPDVDASRVAATGISMGASAAMVLAWREPRIRRTADRLRAERKGTSPGRVRRPPVSRGWQERAGGQARAVLGAPLDVLRQPHRPLRRHERRMAWTPAGRPPPLSPSGPVRSGGACGLSQWKESRRISSSPRA